MKLETIKNLLDAEVLWGNELLHIDVTNACGADLISDILADLKSNAVLLTGLTHRQIIQTACMSDFAAIVFVRGKAPSKNLIELAKQQRLPLLRTNLPLFETCGILYKAGLTGGEKLTGKSSKSVTKGSEPVEGMKLSYDVIGSDFNNSGKATEQVKGILKQIGIDSAIIRRVAIAAYEAEMNIVIHAKKGKMYFNITPKYIEVIADDMGPGISDIDRAMQEGFSTAPDRIRELGFGAGMGLPNMNKFSDLFEINSIAAKGTKVRMVINL